MKYVFPACFHLAEEGGYWVTFPDLEGCFSQGETLADAMSMATDAAAGWIMTLLEDRQLPPKPSTLKDIPQETDTIINLILIDIDYYNQIYSKKAVKKTLTIPAWLNHLAEDKHINFSQTLQEALVEKLDL